MSSLPCGRIRESETAGLAAEAELAKLSQENNQLYQLYLGGALPRDAFDRRHKPIPERRRHLKDELPRLQTKLDVKRVYILETAAIPMDALLPAGLARV